MIKNPTYFFYLFENQATTELKITAMLKILIPKLRVNTRNIILYFLRELLGLFGQMIPGNGRLCNIR